MANQEQLILLQKGVESWNSWRLQYQEKIDLSEAPLHRANLEGANLSGADLSGAFLYGANLIQANLSNTNLYGADLSKAKLAGANLCDAYLEKSMLTGASCNGCDLMRADLSQSHLVGAIFSSANLSEADFTAANLSTAYFFDANLQNANLFASVLSRTNFSRANLTGANLSSAILVETVLEKAILNNCKIYGISVWNLQGTPKDQSNLVITSEKEFPITVDDLQLGQFIHLLLNNKIVRNVIDTITSKVVLILGSFAEERKLVLNALREELRQLNFAPIIFDFEKNVNKDLTGTVETLSRLARFVIADLTDPKCVSHELATIIPFLRTTPVIPIKLKSTETYAMFADLPGSYKWVLKTIEYKNTVSLIKQLPKIISRANEKIKNLGKGSTA